MFVVFLVTADYCLKYSFAIRDMRRNYNVLHYQSAVSIWVPFYIHYELKGPLTEIEHSFIGAFGFYYLTESSSTAYHPRGGKLKGIPFEHP